LGAGGWGDEGGRAEDVRDPDGVLVEIGSEM
jgi:hypothetical protein